MDSPNRKKGLGKIIGGFGLIILVPIIVSVLTPPFQTPLTGYVLTTVVSFIVGCILIMYGTMQLSRIKRLDNQTGTVEADTAIKKPSLAKIIVPLVILVILSFVLLTLQFHSKMPGLD